MKFGKNRNESMPHGCDRPGLSPGGSSSEPMSGVSHGPNMPLRSTRSIGLTIIGSFGGAMPPHDDCIAVRAVELVVQALVAEPGELARLVGARLLTRAEPVRGRTP